MIDCGTRANKQRIGSRNGVRNGTHTAESSRRRKAGPYRSALSTPTFYTGRTGRSLPAASKKVLEQARLEPRRTFGRD